MNEQELLNRIFFALSDPTRRSLLARLVNEDIALGELAENYEISLPAISKHLQVLKDAELVDIRKSGRKRIVRLNTNSLSHAQIWLSTLSDEEILFENLEAQINALINSAD